MSKFIAKIKKFLRREESPTMVEYSLMVSMIAVVVAVAAVSFGKALKDIFEGVAELYFDD